METERQQLLDVGRVEDGLDDLVQNHGVKKVNILYKLEYWMISYKNNLSCTYWCYYMSILLYNKVTYKFVVICSFVWCYYPFSTTCFVISWISCTMRRICWKYSKDTTWWQRYKGNWEGFASEDLRPQLWLQPCGPSWTEFSYLTHHLEGHMHFWKKIRLSYLRLYIPSNSPTVTCLICTRKY